jgi:hypothetical protein
MIFVKLPLFHAWYKAFPDAALIPSWCQVVGFCIPVIEVSDNGDSRCIGGPYTEIIAFLIQYV